MFLPLKDDTHPRTRPLVSAGLIVLNVVVFLYEASLWGGGNPAGSQAWRELISEFGLLPCRLSGRCSEPGLPPAALTAVTSMFLHGGILHVAGNMLYLWIFGASVEQALGHARFLLFYVASGLAGTIAETLVAPGSAVPMIGASGAISGVLGAYLVLFPHATVVTLLTVGVFIRLVRVPALLVLGLWVVLQLVSGLLLSGAVTDGADGMATSVAWFAHLGGFAGGIGLLLLLRPRARRAL